MEVVCHHLTVGAKIRKILREEIIDKSREKAAEEKVTGSVQRWE